MGHFYCNLYQRRCFISFSQHENKLLKVRVMWIKIGKDKSETILLK